MNQIAKPKLLSKRDIVVYIDYRTWHQLLYLAQGCKLGECQWLSCVRCSASTPTELQYYINEFFVPKQEVTGASADSPEENMGTLLNEIKEYCSVDGVLNKEQYNDILKHINCWGHSHVNMAVSPSYTDETTYHTWIDNMTKFGSDKPAVMIIINCREDVYLRLHDPVANIYIENHTLIIDYPEVDASYVDDALKNKLTKPTFKASNYKYDHYHSRTQSKTNLNDQFQRAGSKLFTSPQMISKNLLQLANESSLEAAQEIVHQTNSCISDSKVLCLFLLLLTDPANAITRWATESKQDRAATLAELLDFLISDWLERPSYFYAAAGIAMHLHAITDIARQTSEGHTLSAQLLIMSTEQRNSNTVGYATNHPLPLSTGELVD